MTTANQFPAVLKASEVFRGPVDDVPAHVDPQAIIDLFAKIRRSGNWPKPLLRMPNLIHRITTMLLEVLAHDSDKVFSDKVFIRLEMSNDLVGERIMCDKFQVMVTLVNDRQEKVIDSVSFFKPKA
jgi:hypothetical protein